MHARHVVIGREEAMRLRLRRRFNVVNPTTGHKNGEERRGEERRGRLACLNCF
jgi:hypothetical protein